MAVAAVTNKSTGIYFREIDLTIITQAVGTFAGAMLGLTEKGPAFQIMASTTFSERIARMGNLNPEFPSSYYAREFLAQATNYKEVRILGLEGYNEEASEGGTDKAFAIQYAVIGASTRLPVGVGPFTAPVIASLESVAAILKPRRTTFTQFAAVDYVTIGTITQRDGITIAATDDLFSLTINYVSPLVNLPLTVPCSLRPSAPEYIGTVFGTDPRDASQVVGRTSPLWVDFVYDSLTRKVAPINSTPAAYFYPGTTTPALQFLNILQGDITVQTGFSYPAEALSSVTIGASTVAFAVLPASIVNGTPIIFSSTGITVTNIVGLTSLDGTTFYAGAVVAGVSCQVYSDAALTLPVATSGVFVAGTIQQVFMPTWETEVMTLGGSLVNEQIPFQTPITPWFVSDADMAGNTQRLFRIWSISDGDNANTEIKLEIANINPDGNLGFGSFDILVRLFGDRDDQQKQIVEAYTNLSLNPKSVNYIARRIGDGEIFPLQSRYIFVEIESANTVPTTALPYGVEGYVDTTGLAFPDVVWTTEFDFNKSLSKQELGLANNQTNAFATLTGAYLSFKNVNNLAAATGKGFHLNPLNNGLISTAKFALVNQNIYQVNPPSNTNPISGQVKTQRSGYVVAMAGGFNAFNKYNERDWGTVTSADYAALQQGIDILADFESLPADFSVLVTPDLNFEDHASAAEAVLEMVSIVRGDALYIPDFRYDVDAIPANASLSLGSSQMNSNFVAVYFPHVQISDDVNNTNVWLPPSIIALATIAATATNEQVWQPPAGSLRTVTDNLVRTRKRMRLADREILKAASINPITEFPGSGFEITESRTTQSFLSALSFVHNRLLLGYAKKALSQILRPLLQQLNSVNLQNSFINTVTPVFDRIKKLNGLETFTVAIDTSNPDRTTLNGVITIVPLYPVERIIVDFVLENGTLNFNQ
jgi:hypothetical protein